MRSGRGMKRERYIVTGMALRGEISPGRGPLEEARKRDQQAVIS